MSGRYVAVLFLRPEDDRRRWLVIDLRPWEDKTGTPTGKAGAVVADVMGEGRALRIAAALNGQPDPEAADELVTPSLGRLGDVRRLGDVPPGPDQF